MNRARQPGPSKDFNTRADSRGMLQERSEARMLCAEIVKIRWIDKSGRGHKSTAILEDISASGACIQLDAPLPVSTSVRIKHPKGELNGNVRYCVYRDIGYFVGLQFEPDSKWSRRDFQPQHLLDLHRLLGRAIRSAARRVQKTTVQ